MIEPRTFFLSSLDSARFEPVREFEVVRVVSFDTGKPALVGDLAPAVIGQDFGRGEDIRRVVLTARHEGVQIDPIVEFPCFVHISLPDAGTEELRTPIRADDLRIIGWGELYRTAEDARTHDFGLGSPR